MRWIGVVVLALLVVVIGLFTVSKVMGPTSEQRAALALLDADDPRPEGRNAFGAMWLIEYDVPLEEAEAVVAADVEDYRRALADAASGQVLSNQVSVAEGRYTRRRSDPSDLPDCGRADASCLAKVRERQNDYAQQVARDRAMVERIRGLAAFGHYRSPMENHIFPPLPPYKSLFATHTASALDFVEGRTDDALEAVCTDVETWRRLSVNGDVLIFSMIGGAMVNVGTRLFSDMLAELPLDHPLPSICTTALDPAHVAPNLCSAMRGEERIAQAHLDSYGDEAYPFLRSLLLDVKATRAFMAPVYAQACAEDVRRALIDDTAIAYPPVFMSPWQLQCVSNVLGCSVTYIGVPAYAPYLRRAQDVQAMLRTVDTVVHLRERAVASGKTVAQIVREDGLRPAVETWRTPVFDEVAEEIGIPLREHSGRAEWRIPLPGSKQHD